MSESIPEPPQPALLADFPRFRLGTDVRLWRLHYSHREPNWFAVDPGGRFNPPAGDQRFGTCYVSAEGAGAFLETVGRTGTGVIDETDLLRRSMSTLSLSAALDVADLTAPPARGRFGLTGEMSAGGPSTYPRTQAWAAALFGAGFGGVRYRARNAPALDLTSFAIFGGPGVDDKVFATPSTFPVELDWLGIHELIHTYGFRLAPPPPGGL